MKQAFSRYFGNEYDIPPGQSEIISMRGKEGGWVKLWGTDVIGFCGTSHVKAADCQVLVRLIVSTPSGDNTLVPLNHTGEPALYFGLSWQPAMITLGEAWIEYSTFNPVGGLQQKAFEFQVNIFTEALKKAKAKAKRK
jgi:hypothetical protein